MRCAHRARARDAPRVKIAFEHPFLVFWAVFGPKTPQVPLLLALFYAIFGAIGILCGVIGENVAVGAAWLKAWICENRKNRRLPSLTQRGTHLYVSLRNHCDAAQMSIFFPKGPLRGTKSSVITSRARGPSVLRRKNGFQPRFGAFLANSILGRLVAPNVSPTRLMMPLLDIIGANARLGGVNTPRTPPK